ncbi:MAG: hypothetical protein HOD72_13120 [Opitutae bacterium]|jgi:multicomponent Na+:H+ antiporter subunit B|nr:hypothetical protein [Opitutae bacterium]MBT5379697.1 hypothetical protein [Opitutae bacterium]MBT5691278.1 hypothetical protein [Opitutae bacterium]MBT6462312.1 hypothetical protein [Opitutae bacterium]MBT7854397.1 hypothetical protein [Opitutae bacterium]
MKKLAGIVVFTVGLILLYGVSSLDDFPSWGTPDSPANKSPLSQYFIKNTIVDTEVPNMVTAVLADYRGYDTMFETVVIFVAGLGIFAVVRVFEHGGASRVVTADTKPDIIITNTCRLLIPLIQLFALYVLAHGHSSPGGGFQGGVIMGASFILVALAWDLDIALKRFSEKQAFICSGIGILIYAGFGLASVFLGEEFLNYGIIHKILPGVDSPEMARYYAMLGVEIGVMFTVTSIMFLIYGLLATRGKMTAGL